jgi:hypothetical protein
MLPKIRSFPQQLIANLRVSEAKVSGRCGMSRLRLGALLVLICFAALQPSKSFSEAAFAVGQWGNGAWASGSAYNYRTRSEAEIAAMNSCNQRGYNCSIRTTFRKACFALASQDGGSGWQTGIHSNPDEANRYALLNCAKGGLRCTICEEFCDTLSEAELVAAGQAEYQQFVQNWNVCFGRDATASSNQQISHCDYALTFRQAQPADRGQLVKQRDALIAARNQEVANKAALDAQKAAADKQVQEEFGLYELRWQHCFDPSAPTNRLDHQIAWCNDALAYPQANVGDRAKLTEQRDALVFSRDQLAQEERNGREQTTVDPLASTRWDFSWLGFLVIVFFLQVLSIGSLVMLLGWSVLTKRTRAAVFKGDEAPRPTIREVRIIVISSGSLLAAAMLLGFLLYRVPFEYEDLMLLGSFMSGAFGNSLAALATGAWTSSTFFNPNARFQFGALVPIWIVVAVTWISLLSSHAVYASGIDYPIIVGVAFAWTFVLGYVLCDPLINPLIEKLDKHIEQLSVTLSRLYDRRRGVAKGSGESRELAESWNTSGASISGMVKFKQSQRTNWRGQVIFMLDARMEVPPEVYGQIKKYGLGSRIIYDSAKREKYMAAAQAHLEKTKDQPSWRDPANIQFMGIGKTPYRIMRALLSKLMVRFSLRITVKKLMRGVHVESKSLGEVLAIGDTIRQATERVRDYIDVAEGFDGQEEIHVL